MAVLAEVSSRGRRRAICCWGGQQCDPNAWFEGTDQRERKTLVDHGLVMKRPRPQFGWREMDPAVGRARMQILKLDGSAAWERKAASVHDLEQSCDGKAGCDQRARREQGRGGLATQVRLAGARDIVQDVALLQP